MKYRITALYQFSKFDEEKLKTLEEELYSLAEAQDIIGLIILAPEGINGTVASSEEGIAALKSFIQEIPGCEDTVFKDSYADFPPFRRFKVKQRSEIVTLEREDLKPTGKCNGHVPPSEWHRILNEEEDFVMIDTRNVYETEVGIFKGAVDPGLSTFTEFKEYVKNCGIPKEKKVLMYCTGGIRCEKASLEMQEQGYQNVVQLEGGILKYLEEYPDGHWEGECFVFDHRVAVDNKLEPSKKFTLCPHCGNPASERIECKNCDVSVTVCSKCLHEDAATETCSKNCAHHYRLKLNQGERHSA
jgi:UPF0176 protein